MIKLSNLADYAVVLMSTIAARPDELHTAASLNTDTKVPLPTVSKILGKLARAKLLKSHRGIGGGFSMNADIENISIADIVEAVDGPVQLTNCLSESNSNCDYEPGCLTKSKWDKINNAVYEALNSVPLSEMVTKPYDFFPLPEEEQLNEKKG
ncbi:MAG: SUF system Fe-S cluster assembly regulator [Kordiimonadaceae bacterium]|jgi:FeS assembly SUF system regulator|nr:SUF system Fe-S cluster assembly regulator [Kordiimonadaceae bacterium]MBT6035558.1 SUF system Fe-S cluster assembly regulator [Kordiimonadaceae bacterium]MBT6330862.1 SUF system Fe-S cluster assembly regulator [Kordiimonadaceae bacterium]MBT7581915.1 SUF system Fe-S cluster assembly regulator [Kordiimonadaceae bacterium]